VPAADLQPRGPGSDWPERRRGHYCKEQEPYIGISYSSYDGLIVRSSHSDGGGGGGSALS
jgi:hypothetical protein